MRLLVSDYDGTFYTSDKKIKLNIEAINKFRENGNKFVIATGRSFKSIKKQIDKYNIEYDYLICNNGLIIFDNNDNIIYSSILSDSNLTHILNFIKNSGDVNEFNLYSLYSSTEKKKDILEVYVKFKKNSQSKECKKIIEKIFQNLFCYVEKNKVFISNKVDKSKAVSFIKILENINYDDLYTIGDNKNDLDMLLKFNGYRILCSNPSIWFKNIPLKKDVYTLVKKIDK